MADRRIPIYEHFLSAGVNEAEATKRALALDQLDNDEQLNYAVNSFDQFDRSVAAMPEKKRKVYKKKYNAAINKYGIINTIGVIDKYLKGRTPNEFELGAAGLVVLGHGLGFTFSHEEAKNSNVYTEKLAGGEKK